VESKQASKRIEPGSFRDPDSRVFVTPDGVFRVLSADGLDDWRALSASPLFERLVAEGSLIETSEASDASAVLAELEGTEGTLAKGPAAVLRHEQVPFVSYPYEWTFAMLKDAALLELDLLLASLDEGLILKDATPYNVQWKGPRPVFIDVGSFERLREGEPWAGYRQFCMQFLYPLMIQAYRDIPFQPWLRGRLEGIAPAEAARLLPGRHRLRRGVLSHVVLHARLERRYEGREGGEVRGELRRARFGTEMIRANARRLRRLVARLEWKPGASAWARYRDTSTYTDEDSERKAEFVRRAVAELRPGLTWDLGCNDGAYSRVAAEPGGYVVALDSDHATVEAVYRSLRDEGDRSILPLVADLADPSPGLGWRGAERRPLPERGAPDLVLCLALVHHLSITANVPVDEVVGWLAGLGAALVVEFPARDDPMVRRLLSAKREGTHPDYDRNHFERCLAGRFRIERREELGSGTRTLYFAVPAA
jgi:ribosomal protein L11 methylase PrmA